MRPFVTLKIACTLDGKIATHNYQSKWITGKASRHYAHQLRDDHDAILVGINTVIADNPKLTTRNIHHGKSPIRIILDSHGRIPHNSHCLKEDGNSIFLIVGSLCSISKVSNMGNHITILQAPTKTPQISWILDELSKFGIQSVLIEGGGKIHASFLVEQYFDRIVLFMAPKVIGGDGISWCAPLGITSISEAILLQIEQIKTLGEDVILDISPKPSISNS